MSGMIEKIARAAQEADMTWAFNPDGDRFKQIARAVLMAMREPGISTHNAGAFGDWQSKEPVLRVDHDGFVRVDWRPADPSKMFTAMIDAILSE